MSTIAETLSTAYSRLNRAESAANRAPNSVVLLAVSKTKPIDDIVAAYAAGQRQFGENYVQEGVEKIQALSHLEGICWHYIGPIQSNKTKLIAEHFDWVQTLSREKIAQRLNDQRPSAKGRLNVCIQVNISEESNKSGISSEALMDFAEHLSTLPNLQLRGLMAIPEHTDDEQKLGSQLAQLHQHFTQLQQCYSGIDTLSVGMSQDLELAVQHGSTMVRLGTAIFGSRDTKK